jgi:hypothetical protein
MTRAHGVLICLLAVSLVWAYSLTRPEWWPTGADKPVPLWTLEARDVTRVEYNEAGSKVALKADSVQKLADGSPSWWIDAEGPAAAAETPPAPPAAAPARPGRPGRPPLPARPGRPGAQGAKPAPSTTPAPPAKAPGPAGTAADAKPAAPAAAAAAAASPAPKPGAGERASFRGGNLAANVVRTLAQLASLREIGRPDAKQLLAYGLDKPTGTLRIERTGGEPLLLNLGIPTVGGGNRYAALPDGRVFIVQLNAFRQMEHARRLMDREWIPYNIMLEAQRVEARMGKQVLKLWRLDVPSATPQRWAKTQDAKQGDPAAQAWVQSLMGVKVLDYLGADALPKATETEIEITVYRDTAAKGAGGSPAGGKSSPGSPLASASQDPSAIVLRIFPAGGKHSGKVGADRQTAISPYTIAPVQVSSTAVKAVVDSARALLGSHTAALSGRP